MMRLLLNMENWPVWPCRQPQGLEMLTASCRRRFSGCYLPPQKGIQPPSAGRGEWIEECGPRPACTFILPGPLAAGMGLGSPQPQLSGK